MLVTTENPLAFSADWEDVARIVRENTHFLITTHVNADPDGLGSELALAEALRAIHKHPLILNPTPVSRHHLFLDSGNEVNTYGDDAKELKHHQFDAVFILDISRWERLGPLADPIRFCGRPRICIDHHPYTGGFSDYHLVNTNACATAEIVYDLINYIGIPVDQRMAECLYASMLSDTGSFSFSNTNARCHRIVSELLNHSVSPRLIFEQLYQNQTPERLKFLGAVLSNLQFDCSQKLAWMTITHQMLKENGLSPEDVDGFVDIPRNCREVLLSILFLEVEPDDIKISLRSKGDFNSNKLASVFGGGGHNHASGIRLQGSLSMVEAAVLTEARKELGELIE